MRHGAFVGHGVVKESENKQFIHWERRTSTALCSKNRKKQGKKCIIIHILNYGLSWSHQAWSSSTSAPSSRAAFLEGCSLQNPPEVCAVISAVWGLPSSKQRKGSVPLLLPASALMATKVLPPPEFSAVWSSSCKSIMTLVPYEPDSNQPRRSEIRTHPWIAGLKARL